MQTDDDMTARVTLGDVPAALGLLSRLPVQVDTERATARGARSAWAYPLVGLVLSVLAGLVAQGALWLGISSALAAGLALVSLVVTTGAMHEDGLSDAADGLWGGWDKARRLEIMKDSRIGAYGVIALVLGLGLRWQGLIVAMDHGVFWPALIVTAMLSRAMMVPLMAGLPHARDNGLSHSVGRPETATAGIAVAIAAAAAFLLLGWIGLVLMGVAFGIALACAQIAKTKIGGQTGDILGATQQVTEIALLITLSALIA